MHRVRVVRRTSPIRDDGDVQEVLATTTLRRRARGALSDERLRRTLRRATDRFSLLRGVGQQTLSNWDELRDAGRAVRTRVLADLPRILERLSENVEANGGHVHWATTAQEASSLVVEVARRRGARLAVKSKSMATEEIALNDHLEAAGIEVVETDLGEWIVQLAGETPSHILAPAVHRSREEIAELFGRVAGHAVSELPEDLCAFARRELRERFLRADLGISGVNLAVAETGSIFIVTNEGNGRMVTSLPRTHVAVMGMERVVETWDQLELMLALLPRAASGQDITVYANAMTGPRRAGEVDGPDEFHLVIVDNGRSEILGTELQEILHCIRCGACLNVCPVYRQIGGHAYGGVYSGPVGAVLTPLLDRAPHAPELAQASSLCGACWEACPVRIPLHDLLLALRRREAPSLPRAQRAVWRAWAETWSRPAAYRASVRTARTASRIVPERMAPDAWTDGRSLPRPPSGPGFRERFDRGEL